MFWFSFPKPIQKFSIDVVGHLNFDTKLKNQMQMGTPAQHLNEQNWIIDGFSELIADFFTQLVLFLDSIQPRI